MSGGERWGRGEPLGAPGEGLARGQASVSCLRLSGLTTPQSHQEEGQWSSVPWGAPAAADVHTASLRGLQTSRGSSSALA